MREHFFCTGWKKSQIIAHWNFSFSLQHRRCGDDALVDSCESQTKRFFHLFSSSSEEFRAFPSVSTLFSPFQYLHSKCRRYSADRFLLKIYQREWMIEWIWCRCVRKMSAVLFAHKTDDDRDVFPSLLSINNGMVFECARGKVKKTFFFSFKKNNVYEKWGKMFADIFSLLLPLVRSWCSNCLFSFHIFSFQG